MKRADRRVAVLGVAALVSSVAGCVGYHSYPPTPEQRARADMGERAPIDVMALALQRTLTLHPPSAIGASAFAVNLPVTTPPDTYAIVAQRVGGEPLTPETASLPTYHIARVWVRNSKAKVDVVWPAGDGIDRATTVWLVGGLEPWAVERVQEWNPNVIPTPEPYYIMRSDMMPVHEPAPSDPLDDEATPGA